MKTYNFRPRSLVSILLVFLMLAGQFTAVYAAESSSDSDRKIFVTIGDSMTNGYGLQEDKDPDGNNLITKEEYPTLLGQSYGYDISGHQGYLEISTKAYPWHVSQHYDWDLIQLATSASRAEDIHYILEYDYENDVPGEYKGDNWTQTELAQNQNRWGSHTGENQINYGVKDAYGIKNAARIYQQAVSDADVISLSLGNGNLGVFMTGTITQALGIFGTPSGNDWIRFEDAIAPLDKNIQDVLMGMYDEIYAELLRYIPKEQADPMFRGVSYAMASFIINYMGTIDRVMELNPDAEVILLGLMNTLSGTQLIIDDENNPVDLGNIMSMALEPLNYFMVAYPTMMQATGEFSEADFIYAETEGFETVSQTVNAIIPAENPLIRDRYVTHVKLEIFSIISGIMRVDQSFTLSDVFAFEKAAAAFDEDPSEFIALVNKNPSRAQGAAIYLAFEKALLAAAAEPIELNAIAGLADFGEELFANVFTEYEKALSDIIEEKSDMISAITELAGSQQAAEKICQILSIPDTLSATLLNKDLDNGTVFGLLNVYTRFKLADGHPSVKGHIQLSESIIKAYDEKYSSLDYVSDTFNDAFIYLRDEGYLAEIFGYVKEYLAEYGIVISDDIYDYISDYPESLQQSYRDATTGEVVYEDDLYYVSIGDGITSGEESYGKLLADELGATYVELGDGTLRADDIRYILDEEYVPDDYSSSIENIDTLRAQFTEEIRKADLITLGIGNITPFVTQQLCGAVLNTGTYETDWARFVGSENVKYVEAALDEIKAYFIQAGLGEMMGIDLAEVLTLTVESYIYAYAGFAFNYAELANDIHQLNPDAELVLVGSYNPFKELMIIMSEEPLNAGEYINYLIELTDIQFLAYSMMTPNTTFVEVNDVDPQKVITTEIDLILEVFADSKVTFLSPDEKSHEYIKDAIIKAVSFTKTESEKPEIPEPPVEPVTGLLGDVDLNGIVNAVDATQILRYCNAKASVFTTATEEELALITANADVDKNGLINAVDATQILRFCNAKPSALDK